MTTSNVERLLDAAARLADRGVETGDIREDGLVATRAWWRPRSREHRHLRLPEDVWARLRASTNEGSHLALDEDPYARFLPPRAFLGMDRDALADPVILEAAGALAQSWVAMHTDLATDPADLALIVERFSGDAWQAQVDEGDDPVANEDHPGGAIEATHLPPTSAAIDPAVAHLFLDAAARRALSRFLRALDRAGIDRSALDPAALLAGLWGGGVREPRLDEEWARAATRAESAERWTDLGVHDVAAARVTLLADNAIGSVDPDAWERLVTWAYGRAQRWPRHRTVDPALHQHLIEGWRADRAARVPLPEHVAGPGQGCKPVWSSFIIDAVSTGRIPASEPEPDVEVVRPAPTTDLLLAELDAMQGLDEVKARMLAMVQFARFEQDRASRGLPNDPISRHLVLVGNPGTGKTTVARLIGRILHAAGALPSSAFHEVRRSDFVSPYRGGTETKTRELLNKARGGVLFIDEAYALANEEHDSAGNLILAELVPAMENHRDELVVIAAGYPAPMTRFLDANPGLKSRFAGTVLFPDLDDAALTAAFVGMLETGGYTLDEAGRAAVREHFSRLARGPDFGNAREARNLYDVVRRRLASRHAAAPGQVDPAIITRDDIPRPPGPAAVDEAALADAMAAIDRLVGLTGVKQSLADSVAAARVARARWQQDPSIPPFMPGHFAFVGRPGTGKTTIAQQLGQVYRAMGVLRSGHMVNANRASLVGQFVGQTAPKVRESVRAAVDGVLFIDEAYALLPTDSYRDFGPEALATLVEEMELHRDRLVVILAGYPKEMEHLLAGNAGLASRVRTTVRFEDYTLAELQEIAQVLATQQGLILDPAAATRIAAGANAMRGQAAFANGRTVRNLLDDSITRQARRVAPLIGSGVDGAELSTVRVEDVPDVAHSTQQWGLYL